MNKRKRFPADTGLDELNFLNDKGINGELYAYLQGLSESKYNATTKEYETVVSKSDISTQAEICKTIGIKSPKTLRAHLNYLIERGYVIKDKHSNYILPNKEDIYLLIPTETTRYLNDNCREHIIKIYIYLGQRHKYALSHGAMYEFTLEEIGEHIGLKVKNSSRGYELVNNALDLLCNSGLIDYCSFFDGSISKKKLTSFSYEYRKNSK